MHSYSMYRFWRLLSPATWTAVWHGIPELLAAIKHFERLEYGAALQSFEGLLNRIPNPGADYLAFHAYLLLLNGNGTSETDDAWKKVVASAEGDTALCARFAGAVARYFLSAAGSHDRLPRWREANALRPSRGLVSYIRLPEIESIP